MSAHLQIEDTDTTLVARSCRDDGHAIAVHAVASFTLSEPDADDDEPHEIYLDADDAEQLILWLRATLDARARRAAESIR